MPVTLVFIGTVVSQMIKMQKVNDIHQAMATAKADTDI